MMQPPTPPIVIDLEASGFGSGSYPIEVGYVLPCGEAYCTLIQPQPGWNHWDSSAARLHGIEREQLLEHGRSALQVAHYLNRQLQGQTVYSDAWGQDHSWLLRLYDAVGMWPSFKLETIRYIISEKQLPYWQLARRQIEQELGLRRHRASADARIIQQTYMRSWALAYRQVSPVSSC